MVRVERCKPFNRRIMRRDKEYKYRVLVYPNITKKYNEILKDSYIVLIPKVLRAITKINPSIHFTILNQFIYLN